MDNNELQHHGIKGMRWGIRRTDAQLARARGASTASPKPQQPQTSAKGTTKSTDTDDGPTSTKALKERNERLKLEKEYKSLLMNDDELQQRVNRLKLEKEYQQLTAKEKSKGKQLVEEVLYSSAKTVLGTFVTGALNKMVGNVLSKDKGDKDGADEAKKDEPKKTKDGDSSSDKKTDAESKAKKTAEAFSNAKKASPSYTTSAKKTYGQAWTKKTTKDRVIYDADFVDVSPNAGRSFFDTVFALPPAPSALALPAPKDD